MAFSSQNNLEGSIDDTFDHIFDQHFDQSFENFTIQYGDQEKKKRKKQAYIKINREEGHVRLWNDYFSETSTYPENLF